jgi:hypothetical protein
MNIIKNIAFVIFWMLCISMVLGAGIGTAGLVLSHASTILIGSLLLWPAVVMLFVCVFIYLIHEMAEDSK